MKLQPKHKFPIGCVMLGVAFTAPIIAVPLHLELWQGLLYLNAPCWVLSWFSAVAVGKGWAAIRKERFDIEQAELGTLLDRHFARMASLKEPNEQS